MVSSPWNLTQIWGHDQEDVLVGNHSLFPTTSRIWEHTSSWHDCVLASKPWSNGLVPLVCLLLSLALASLRSRKVHTWPRCHPLKEEHNNDVAGERLSYSFRDAHDKKWDWNRDNRSKKLQKSHISPHLFDAVMNYQVVWDSSLYFNSKEWWFLVHIFSLRYLASCNFYLLNPATLLSPSLFIYLFLAF